VEAARRAERLNTPPSCSPCRADPRSGRALSSYSTHMVGGPPDLPAGSRRHPGPVCHVRRDHPDLAVLDVWLVCGTAGGPSASSPSGASWPTRMSPGPVGDEAITSLLTFRWPDGPSWVR
jgi:hypothetical protein